jgi:hypothetical protein
VEDKEVGWAVESTDRPATFWLLSETNSGLGFCRGTLLPQQENVSFAWKMLLPQQEKKVWLILSQLILFSVK